MSNPDRLKKIDRYFHGPASWVGKLGSAALSFRKADAGSLILRPGGMGDLIFLTIAMEEMGLSPQEPLWLIEKRSEPWAKQLKLRYLCYDRSPLGTHLEIAARYKTVLNTEQRFGLAQATALLAKARGGKLLCFDTNLGASFVGADQRIPYNAYGGHETVEFARMLHVAFGGNPLNSRPVRKRAKPASTPVLVGIGGLQSDTRKLSVEKWQEYVETFAAGVPIEIARAPVDREFAEELARRLGSRARIFEGDFAALCERISTAKEVLTIDSGFLHMASYYGVSSVSIFTSSRADKWLPLAADSRIVLRTDLKCQPCSLFAQVPPCPHGYVCREVDFRRDLQPA